MFADFFQLTALPTDQFNGSYDIRLVALSYMVAVFASYIALDMAGRLRDPNTTETAGKVWLFGGAIAMGAGIWSMHFIGMLSFTIPNLAFRYDLFWTAISLLVAISASGFALYLLKEKVITLSHFVYGGVILGIGIASMHYTGMEALQVSVSIRYVIGLFVLSLLIAITASEAAIWLAIKSNQVVFRMRNKLKLVSAIIMGIAICGMHYTGMVAAVFSPLCTPSVTADVASSIDPTLLAIGIAGITCVILAVAFFASSYREAINQQQLEAARQLGMAEVSASVLHNVGNVLNSVNVSVNTVGEKVSASKLADLEKLSALLNEHKDDLPGFLNNAQTGGKIIDFLNVLSQYWRDEKAFITNEVATLNKNIQYINQIISTQQDLSKIITPEQVISIPEVINEALLITGLNTKSNITVTKNINHIKPVLIDKVKLLQVLVNLFQNAKDAVKENNSEEKTIHITARIDSGSVIIEITDNGVGIPENLQKKIFNYGFTTKPSGHGFGLHTCALNANSMGGDLNVESGGTMRGAKFILKVAAKNP